MLNFHVSKLQMYALFFVVVLGEVIVHGFGDFGGCDVFGWTAMMLRFWRVYWLMG